MAISDKLNYLIETKQLFKDRLNSLGAEITSSTTFRNYLNWLDTFYGEVSDKTDLSQNGVVGRTSQESTTGKNLFGDTLEVGTINSSGNNSTSTDNMRNADYISVNQQTTYTISASSNCYIGIRYYNSSKTFLSSGTTAEQPNTFTTPANCKYVRFVFVNITDTTVKVQLEEGTQATPYEEYTGGIPSPNPDYPQPINNLSGDVTYKVSGKNKLPFPYTETTHTSNGVTFTVNNDGSILVNGTATGGNANIKLYGNYQEQNQLKLPSGYLYGGTTNVWLRALNNHGGNYSLLGNDTGEGAEIDTTTYDVGYVELTVKNGTTVNNVLVKPMVLDSLEDTTYEPYISQTFNIPLKSKNLFDKDSEDVGHVYSSTGSYGITALWNTSDWIKASDYITISASTTGSINMLLSEFDNSKTFIQRTQQGGTSKTYNLNTNTKYVRLSYKNDIGIYDIQLKESSTPTDYEPYYDIELCNIDTYEDKIYSSNGRFYLNKNINKVILNGSEGWQNTGSNPLKASLEISDYKYIEENICVCNYFKSVVNGTYGTMTDNQIKFRYHSDLTKRLYICTIVASAINNFKTWLSTHNTTVYYVLATPTTTEITQENYPSLYNVLKQIQDYLTAYKINKEFILGYSSPEIEY